MILGGEAEKELGYFLGAFFLCLGDRGVDGAGVGFRNFCHAGF